MYESQETQSGDTGEPQKSPDCSETEQLPDSHSGLKYFILVIAPICCVYAVSAFEYSSSHTNVWMWTNIVALVILIVALVLAPSHYRNIGRSSKRSMPRILESIVDDDRWFTVLGIALPIVIVVADVMVKLTHVAQPIVNCVMSVLCIAYLVYLGLLIAVTCCRGLLDTIRYKDYQIAYARRQAMVYRKETQLASRAHDTVAGRLSSIALLAEQHANAGLEDADSWTVVHQVALAALDNLHDVIDVLGDVGAASSSGRPSEISGSGDHSLDRLHQHLEQGDRLLHNRGFAGSSSWHVSPQLQSDNEDNGNQQRLSIDKNRMNEAIHLIDELYANTALHADNSQPYNIAVHIDETGNLVIDQHNTIMTAPADQAHGTPHQSGRGLRLHVAVVRQYGGELEYGADVTGDAISQQSSRIWRLHAELPLSPSPARHATR